MGVWVCVWVFGCLGVLGVWVGSVGVGLIVMHSFVVPYHSKTSGSHLLGLFSLRYGVGLGVGWFGCRFESVGLGMGWECGFAWCVWVVSVCVWVGSVGLGGVGSVGVWVGSVGLCVGVWGLGLILIYAAEELLYHSKTSGSLLLGLFSLRLFLGMVWVWMWVGLGACGFGSVGLIVMHSFVLTENSVPFKIVRKSSLRPHFFTSFLGMVWVWVWECGLVWVWVLVWVGSVGFCVAWVFKLGVWVWVWVGSVGVCVGSVGLGCTLALLLRTLVPFKNVRKSSLRPYSLNIWFRCRLGVLGLWLLDGGIEGIEISVED
ncbi:hypothetical protein C1646_674723 [Rhizophagus diaphanus]|nr:hypothetical protein C1646_674723 [Rhizophagus diaphanus] [Rhizophagus sp. MUCL 43196]